MGGLLEIVNLEMTTRSVMAWYRFKELHGGTEFPILGESAMLRLRAVRVARPNFQTRASLQDYGRILSV